jgi:hypothetical protein
MSVIPINGSVDRRNVSQKNLNIKARTFKKISKNKKD